MADEKLRHMRSLARNLRALRQKKGLTQEACADLADVSLKYWQELESPNNTKCPSALLAMGIARIMDVKVEDLFRDA